MKESLITKAIILLGALGGWGSGSISVSHWAGEMSCPTIGPIPACYVIFLGYGLVIFSMHPRLKRYLLVFFIGWVPVITLALIGMAGELTSTLHCPLSETGIPKCYFSAALGLIIGLLYWALYKSQLSKMGAGSDF